MHSNYLSCWKFYTVQVGNPALMWDLICILTMPFLQHRSEKLPATVDQNRFLNASVTRTRYQCFCLCSCLPWQWSCNCSRAIWSYLEVGGDCWRLKQRHRDAVGLKVSVLSPQQDFVCYISVRGFFSHKCSCFQWKLRKKSLISLLLWFIYLYWMPGHFSRM